MRRLLLALALGAVSQLALSGSADAKPKRPRAVAPLSAKPQADAPDKLETLVEVSVLHGRDAASLIELPVIPRPAPSP